MSRNQRSCSAATTSENVLSGRNGSCDIYRPLCNFSINYNQLRQLPPHTPPLHFLNKFILDQVPSFTFYWSGYQSLKSFVVPVDPVLAIELMVPQKVQTSCGHQHFPRHALKTTSTG